MKLEEEAKQKKEFYLNKVLRRIKQIFTPISLIVLAYFTWSSHSTLVEIIMQADLSRIISTVIFLSIIHFLIPIATVIILKSYRIHLSYYFVLKTHITRLPARYLPGGIWHAASRMMDFYLHGLTRPQLALLILLEHVISVGVAFTFGGGCIWYFRGLADNWGKSAALAALGSLIGLILTPRVINQFVLKASFMKLSYSYYMQAVGCFVFIWSVFSFVFVYYISSFPLILKHMSILEVGGSYLFSWAIGFITVLAPQGIGVSEIISSRLLDTTISLMNVSIIILGFRVLILMSDALLWIFFLLYHKCILHTH